MKPILSATGLAIVLAVGACSAPASVAETAPKVAAFHHRIDAEDYAAIWGETSDDMRKVTTEADMEKVFAAVHRKLGKVLKTSQVGWRNNMSTGGNFVSVHIDTKFEKGSGSEEFVYRQVGKELKLAGYHINSAEMMLN